MGLWTQISSETVCLESFCQPMASCNLLQVQAGKAGKPFFLDTRGTWSPWTMVICSDSCDNPQFKPMSQKHLVTEVRYCSTSELSDTIGHSYPLFTKKGAMQLKQFGFCLLYFTNTWLCIAFVGYILACMGLDILITPQAATLSPLILVQFQFRS